MTNKNSGRRGSPKGLRYRDDPPILGKIANALVSEPDAKIKSVIRAIGVEGDANIRRLERHFAAGKIQLMDDARKRAAPPPIVRHAEPHRHNHPLSFASEFELAKCRDATAAYRHLFDRLQPQFAIAKEIADRLLAPSAVGTIMLDAQRNHRMLENAFGNLHSFVGASFVGSSLPDAIRSALLGPTLSTKGK